ncbi:MAG: DUF3575 domain-containing protein [Bacteroidales bacterium]
MDSRRLVKSTFLIFVLILASLGANSQNEADSLVFNSLTESPIDSNNTFKPICNECAFLGLKTNLLYYGVLAPNVEVEILLNKFSLNFEYQFPWYVNSDRDYCYQFLHFGVEGRYWLNRQKIKERPMPYTGGFIGLYYGLGLFDFQTPDKGTQGEINVLAGISGGYTIYLNRSFNLEFSLGFGYMNSNIEKYRTYEDLLVRRTKSEFNYYGPTKAKVSLIWFVNNKYYR